MPAHNILFKYFDLLEVQPPLSVGGATRVCFPKGHAAQLRRMDDNEDRFVPGATYRESWVTLPNWKAAGIQDLYGFKVAADFTGSNKSDVYGGSISFQLSNDNGATWLYHNGSSWTPAGALDWNTTSEVDFNIPDFPLTVDKEIRVKMLLTPSDNGRETPFVRMVTVYADLAYNFQEDLLRSMQEWLERHVWVRAQYFTQVPQPTSGDNTGINCGPSDIILLDDKKWEELSEPVEVYNLTTDPNRTTNLFLGFVAGGIQLTSPQEGFLEATFMARPPVYIGAEEFMQLSSIPSIVVTLGAVKERRDLRRGNLIDDLAESRMKARVHLSRVWFDAEFRISCQSDLKAEATRISDAVNEALSYHRFVRSQQTGEDMPVPYDTPISPTHRVAQGLFVREYSCTLFGKVWLRRDATVERDLSEKLVILTHPMNLDESGYVETTEVT